MRNRTHVDVPPAGLDDGVLVRREVDVRGEFNGLARVDRDNLVNLDKGARDENREYIREK